MSILSPSRAPCRQSCHVSTYPLGGASMGGSDGGAWLNGDAAEAMACDAAMAPFVTGEVNPAMEDLVRLCVRLDQLHHHPGAGGK